MRRLKILIWHVHGSYLYYLTQAPHDFYLPSKPDRAGDYIGRWGHIPWGDNVIDVPYENVRDLDLDCIICQLPHQYLKDRFEILSGEQLKLPTIYLQHDPPDLPTDSKHLVDDPATLLVHVTPYNRLMWDNGRTPTTVIDHGVLIPAGARYSGEIPKGIVVVNHLKRRGRRLGDDVYEAVRREVPIDLVGMAAEESPGGLREVIHKELPAFEARYRFFFNPIRYTSLGLAVCEAMMLGLPVIGLATTEMATAVQNGVSGFVDTDVDKLVEHMRRLLRDPDEARRLGDGARRYAEARFNIRRFVDDWSRTLLSWTEKGGSRRLTERAPSAVSAIS